MGCDGKRFVPEGAELLGFPRSCNYLDAHLLWFCGAESLPKIHVGHQKESRRHRCNVKVTKRRKPREIGDSFPFSLRDRHRDDARDNQPHARQPSFRLLISSVMIVTDDSHRGILSILCLTAHLTFSSAAHHPVWHTEVKYARYVRVFQATTFAAVLLMLTGSRSLSSLHQLPSCFLSTLFIVRTCVRVSARDRSVSLACLPRPNAILKLDHLTGSYVKHFVSKGSIPTSDRLNHGRSPTFPNLPFTHQT